MIRFRALLMLLTLAGLMLATSSAPGEEPLAIHYEWLLYSRQIAEAQHAWEVGDVADARRHLNSCRPDFRGWEHNYLFTRFTRRHELLKTQGPVTSLAYSPDGRRIVSGYAWVVRTWECETGRELLTFTLQMNATSQISSVGFSPDGKRIVFGTQCQEAQILDASSGALLQTLNGHPNGTKIVAFSPDGKRIASGGCRDEEVVMWDATSGKDIRTLSGKVGCVTSLAFSPDGKRVACGNDENTVRIWDTITGAALHTFGGHSGAVESVAFSPDGTRIVISVATTKALGAQIEFVDV